MKHVRVPGSQMSLIGKRILAGKQLRAGWANIDHPVSQDMKRQLTISINAYARLNKVTR